MADEKMKREPTRAKLRTHMGNQSREGSNFFFGNSGTGNVARYILLEDGSLHLFFRVKKCGKKTDDIVRGSGVRKMDEVDCFLCPSPGAKVSKKNIVIKLEDRCISSMNSNNNQFITDRYLKNNSACT